MDKQSNSQKLKTLMSMSVNPMLVATYKLFQHKNFAKLYPEYLISLHWLVRASIPLMNEAIICSRARIDSGFDYDPFITYLQRHCLEEENHDKWILEDLLAIGVNPKESEKIVPSIAVANLVGAQYYWIKHFDPVALIGYIAAIEGNSLSRSYLEEIKATSGIAPGAFRTIELHADIDKDHAHDLYVLVDNLKLEHHQFVLIARSALATITQATKMLEDITCSGSNLI